jgi:hypothetical protein
MLSAGDALPVSVGVAVCARFGPGRAVGGRIVGTRRGALLLELGVRMGGRAAI